MTDSWDDRIDAVWADAAGSPVDVDVIAQIDAIAAERGPDDARAVFERAGARDSAGFEADAEALYRHALALGLDAEHRPQAVIQLASTIRNLGRPDESIALLRAELAEDPDSPYAGAAGAFLALALTSAGEPVEAVAVALRALVPHLPRYHRSVTAYAESLLDPDA